MVTVAAMRVTAASGRAMSDHHGMADARQKIALRAQGVLQAGLRGLWCFADSSRSMQVGKCRCRRSGRRRPMANKVSRTDFPSRRRSFALENNVRHAA